MSDIENVIDVLMTFMDERNTSTRKGCWILDSDSEDHLYTEKEMFDYLVEKKEGIVKIVDGSVRSSDRDR